MNDPVGAIEAVGVVPVVTVDDAADAVPLATALVAGGLDVVEITLRTAAGLDSIVAIAAHVPDAIVGAGSVMTAAQADAAVDAGARFVVSPGFDAGVVDAARERGVVALPGIATATELMRVREHEVDVVKLFPAEAVGGTALVASLSAVWPTVRFVPTGGISAVNAGAYLSMSSVLAVGGSWMVPRDVVAAGDWNRITELAAEASALVGTVR